ncbi:MAG: glutamine-hydrolyzing carbamoyl-phosphate synthase small subunit [Bacteroidales bacterium]|nr:glutamine-hydrolyzing carbamoyl-phosphate synthase small subunit [Bacteroidales bacterium]
MYQSKPAKLVLSDGKVFHGKSFGYENSVSGEIVFNTAMTGYPESLTDPSYHGQILVATYPLIGNYGVPEEKQSNAIPDHFESSRVQISGLVISDYSFNYSHWNAARSLSNWLMENRVPGIYGVDTRALTKIIREEGVMLGKIIIDEEEVDLYDPNEENLVQKVSTSTVQKYGNGKYKVILLDLGLKNNIIRCLVNRDTTVVRVPWDYDFLTEDYDGLFITNGPGDPKRADTAIQNIGRALHKDKPVMGICLGTQLMALATGGDTYKLKYGHRSHNQPVLLQGTNRCYITSQNHGYVVDIDTLGSDWELYFTNLNDNTCEGIRHRKYPFFATQFHPEASGGPVDTEFLFDDFLDLLKDYNNQ